MTVERVLEAQWAFLWVGGPWRVSATVVVRSDYPITRADLARDVPAYHSASRDVPPRGWLPSPASWSEPDEPAMEWVVRTETADPEEANTLYAWVH